MNGIVNTRIRTRCTVTILWAVTVVLATTMLPAVSLAGQMYLVACHPDTGMPALGPNTAIIYRLADSGDALERIWSLRWGARVNDVRVYASEGIVMISEAECLPEKLHISTMDRPDQPSTLEIGSDRRYANYHLHVNPVGSYSLSLRYLEATADGKDGERDYDCNQKSCTPGRSEYCCLIRDCFTY